MPSFGRRRRRRRQDGARSPSRSAAIAPIFLSESSLGICRRFISADAFGGSAT